MHKYKVTRLIRQVGTLIQVYEAVQPELERKVELRLLNAVLEAGSDEQARFEREFKAIARLDHPNIIKVYDWGEADKRLYYITELKTAKTLEAWLQEGRDFAVDEVLGIGLDLAAALAYLHGFGILHRGLATGSVLYDADARRPVINEFHVLTDLGRAKGAPGGEGHLATAATTPEMLENLEPDARADVFLLGALLYRLLSGREPALDLSAGGQAQALLEAGVPSEAAAVVEKAMAFHRDARYPGAAQMARALQDARERLRLADRRASTRRVSLVGEPGRSEGAPQRGLTVSSTRASPAAAPEEPPRKAPPAPASSGPLPAARPGGRPRPSLAKRFADVPIALLALGIGLPIALVLWLAWMSR